MTRPMMFPLLAASLPSLLYCLGSPPKESALGDQDMPPPNMPLWHKDYFEFKANEIQKEDFPELPLCDTSESEDCHKSLSSAGFMAEKMEMWCHWGSEHTSPRGGTSDVLS